MLKGMTYNQACRKLFELAGMPYSFGELGVKTRRQYHYPKEVVCDDKTKVYDYFKRRKISRSTIDYADVRQDDEGNTVFNYYDTNDVLTMVKYRPLEMSRNVQSGNTQNLKSSVAPVRLPAAPASTPGTSQAATQAGCVYRP